MPIAKEAFKSGVKKRQLRKDVVAYLYLHRDLAYNMIEIANGVGLIGGDEFDDRAIPNLIYLYDVLRSLVSHKKVKLRQVDGDFYFMSKYA